MVEEERNETLYKAVGSLPEIQRRRFLLYYEYEFNFYQIAAMEHCTASAIQKSVAIAKEKVKAEIEEISPTVTDTARKRNLFFICVGLAALHTLTFFRGSKSIFKEVNAYVQRKQRHRPKGGKPCRSYRQSTPKRSFMNRL
ncbi:RNA polymerase sigma factor, partial [Streptococcus pyogenes]